MEKDIIKFMDHVKIYNKDLAKYIDNEKGIIFSMNTGQLIPALDYMELDKAKYEQFKFEGKIENLDYKIKKIDKPTPKINITKDEKDKYTIVNQKVDARQVWNLINGVGVYKSFVNKEDAIKAYEDINAKVEKYILL